MSQTQITCGTLEQRADKSFEGTVRLIGRLNGSLFLSLDPNAKFAKPDSEHPDYVVYYGARGEAGQMYEMGRAWLKNHVNVGDFLSLSLTHPDWPGDLSLTVFPPNKDRSEKEWRIVWSRPRGVRVQDQAQAA